MYSFFPLQSARQVLLLDAAGALLSTLFLGGILPLIQPYIGKPTGVLYLLAAIAACFLLYDLLALRFGKGNERLLIRIIAMLNLLYAVLTLSLMVVYAAALMPLGWIYFIVEIVVLLLIVRMEWRFSKGK
jgi:hypothetical protein